MFDVGFFELAMIGLVALLVVGPERLPKVAKTAGMWVGRGRRFVSDVKSDIEKEMQAEELKKMLDKQNLKSPLHEIIEDTKESFEQIKADTAKAASSLDADAVSPSEDDDSDKKIT